MCPVVFLDWIKCVSGARGQERGEPTGLWRESFSYYRAIPSGLASGMWPCLSSCTRLTSAAGSRLGHSTYG